MFDFENGRVGFAESGCKIFDPRGEVTKFEDEEGRGNDCVLKDQSVATSCLQTADLLNCTELNTFVKGTETWSFVVDRPPEMQGKSCEEIIRKMIRKEKGVESVVECNSAGLCTAKTPCKVACEETIPVAPVPQMNMLDDQNQIDTPKTCGDNSWGTCLDTCQQTKIASALYSDGLCHEDVSLREERVCHTEFCGNSNPCHIPFIVHVIIAFRGLSPSFWDKQAEITVVNSFANAIRDSAGETMIDPGDIEVLMTSPWEEIIGDDTGETMHPMMNVLGLKVVLEVHIHNPNFAHFSDNFDAIGGLGGKFMTAMSRTTKRDEKSDTTECKSSDVYKLALKAHEIQFRLEDENFITTLADGFNQEIDITGYTHPALEGFVENIDLFVRESTVISTWTIKTEVSGGSLYDHILDPYPGNLDLVRVSVVQMTSGFALMILLVLSLRYRRVVKGVHPRIFEKDRLRNVAALCPAPFELVTKKLGVNMMLRRRGKRTSNDSHDDTGLNEEHEDLKTDGQFSDNPKKQFQSKLSDIIEN